MQINILTSHVHNGSSEKVTWPGWDSNPRPSVYDASHVTNEWLILEKSTCYISLLGETHLQTKFTLKIYMFDVVGDIYTSPTMLFLAHVN